MTPPPDGLYRTAPQPLSLLGRLLPSATFFATLFGIVWRASRVAKAGRYDDDAWRGDSIKVLHALESVGVRFDVTGLERLAAVDGPCLIVGNHMSTLETMILPGLVVPYRRVTFVVKQSLMDYPIFRYIMRSRHPIAVSQKNPREDLKAMLTQGTARLAEGVSVIVFPQGTRMGEFRRAEFNTIGVKLALRGGVPILPLALSTAAWPMGRWISDLARIHRDRIVRMDFGPPIAVQGRGEAEHQAIVEFVESRLQMWGDAVGEITPESPTRNVE